VLTCVAAVHGAVLSLRLPPRLILNDELQFSRMAFALLGFTLVQGLSLPVWGALSDRFGRQKVIIYSLGLTLITAVLGYAPMLGMRLSPQFVFAVLSGLTMAGLPLAVAYSFSLIKEGPRHHVMATAVCAFFAGVAIMLLLRVATFSLPVSSINLATSTIVLLATAATLTLTIYLLPLARPTSVSFTGMNALHGLWHGFAESNRGSYARWWKAYLGFSAAAAGIVMTSLPGFSVNHDVFSAHVGPLVVSLLSAAAASLATAHFVGRRNIGERIAAISATISILAASVVLYLASSQPAGLWSAGVLCGSGLGSVIVLGVIYFATRAKQRSAGAELGAICAIWTAALLCGMLLALLTFKDDPQVPPCVAIVCSVMALAAGCLATRRPVSKSEADL